MVQPRFLQPLEVPDELALPVQYVQQREPWDQPQTFHDRANRPSSPTTAFVAPTRPALPLAPVATPIYDKSRFPVLSEAVVAAPASSNLFLSAASGKRVMLLLRNVSATANIYISFGQAASANSVLKLAAGTMILFDAVIPQNDVYSFADAAAGFLTYAYDDMELP